MKNYLQKLRKQHKLTQQELGEKMKVTRQTIIAIENGKFNPSVILAIKISRFFGVPVDEIFIVEDYDNED
ncbi:helix-turn-helix transcriptional regulator [Enterococcus nangangensis]|uniref:helix-turn-helix transcriptional regulator n=1 Tax=Enterococcus nangangensis TaxID=2559926 RepID=UPI0010F5E7A9|nr:helix-turn-helix transcriptional regulator [Enterococcus nangangensis]